MIPSIGYNGNNSKKDSYDHTPNMKENVINKAGMADMGNYHRDRN
jgi:hypothetical protein